MFSPSLLSVMLHLLNDGQKEREPYSQPRNLGDLRLDARLRSLLDGFYPHPWPEVPVVAWSDDPHGLSRFFRDRARFREYGDRRGFAWGRIPLNLLVDYKAEGGRKSADREFIDLGTPVFCTAAASSSHNPLDFCRTLLNKSSGSAATVGVAMIDRGKPAPNQSPDTFGGRVRHAITSNVEWSDHAFDVASVLLERLDGHGILDDIDFSCALVSPPANPIGKRWFDHANTVELLDALDALLNILPASPRPVAINLSLGTHVGPHNGQSPVEERVRQLAPPGSGRFMHVAAGNDGMTGVAAVRHVTSGLAEHLKLRTGPEHGRDVLVEFWWEEPAGGATVTMEVTGTIIDPAAARHAGTSSLRSSPLRIDSTSAGATLAHAGAGQLGTIFQSLCHSRCHNSMSCLAFHASTSGATGLPMIDFEFSIHADQDVTVNAWIVVAEDRGCAFLEGGNTGSLVVPSAQRGVLCITGVDRNGQPWPHASRGPACQYGAPSALTIPVSPSLAFDVGASPGSATEGTSFATPRACADAARILHATPNRCNNALDMAQALLGRPLSTWNSRIGFGAVIP